MRTTLFGTSKRGLRAQRGPIRTRRMEGGNNLSTTSYGEYLIVVIVDNLLDLGTKYDTREREFENVYWSISMVTMIYLEGRYVLDVN